MLSSSVAYAETPATTPRNQEPTVAGGCTCPCGKQDTTSEPVRLDPFRRQPGYGLTLLGADLLNLTGHLTLGVLIGEKQGFKDAWPYTLTGIYLLSGPMVHLAYGRPAKAALSLGVRATVPLAFVLLGGLVAPERSAWAVGGAVGAATAIVFDAAVLGRGDYVGVPTSQFRPLTVPWIDHTRRAAGVDMAWTF